MSQCWTWLINGRHSVSGSSFRPQHFQWGWSGQWVRTISQNVYMLIYSGADIEECISWSVNESFLNVYGFLNFFPLNPYLPFDITWRNNSIWLMGLSAALLVKSFGCIKSFFCTDYNILIVIFRQVGNLKCFAESENCYIISYMPLHIFYSASVSPKPIARSR